MSNCFHWFPKISGIRLGSTKKIWNGNNKSALMTANTYRQARIRLSSITSWNRNVSSFPLILIRTSSSHTIEFQFVKPQIIIRHNRSFVSYNISNWWIASKKNPNSQIKLFHCRWNFIILLLIYNITSVLVLFQSHLAFDGQQPKKRRSTNEWKKNKISKIVDIRFHLKTIIIRSLIKRKESHECWNVWKYFGNIVKVQWFFHRFFQTIYFISTFCKNMTLFWTKLGVYLLNRIPV